MSTQELIDATWSKIAVLEDAAGISVTMAAWRQAFAARAKAETAMRFHPDLRSNTLRELVAKGHPEAVALDAANTAEMAARFAIPYDTPEITTLYKRLQRLRNRLEWEEAAADERVAALVLGSHSELARP